MIDKLLLNNQIITNKKKIQQARIQTINKLVQKIRKLKQLNEKKPQNAKISKNLEKIPQILMCLKKMKVSDIIRKILTSNKKPNAVLTNGQALPDDVAIALLASNKIIAAIVETLRTLLTLNETNPGWQNEILELSRRKKKVLETVDRKKNKKTKTDSKKLPIKKLPWKEEKLDDQETQPDQSSTEAAPPKGWNIEPLEETIEDSSVPSKVVKKKKGKEVKETKSLLSTKEQDIADDEVEVSNNAKPATIVDPFFFTETGDNYLSTVVIDRVQPEPLQDGLIRRERRDNAIRPNKRNNIFRRQAASSGNEFENRRQSTHGGRIEKGNNFDHKTNAVETKLHPSWAAKQKLKPAITEFKGHKITFDNDGNDVSPAPSVKTFKTNVTEENLHPSWAAKQKLKPAIAEFKGRKITFDNDGNDVTPAPEAQKFNQSNKHTDKSNAPSLEGIHPSWAAKQKQKPAITEFKGTKITFDD